MTALEWHKWAHKAPAEAVRGYAQHKNADKRELRERGLGDCGCPTLWSSVVAAEVERPG
jgi:hypothetical protein